MLFDQKKLQEILQVATGPLVAVGAFVGAVWGAVEWLQPKYIGREWAIVVSALVACLLLWGAYRALAKKSKLLRLERFDLRVRNRDDLLGRDDDIANLKGLLDESAQVLLDGESGCGKSSLVEFGLVPALRKDPSACPLLVSSYRGDWDVGLAESIFEAAWAGLTPE